ncbi:hypothetical protein AAY473_015598 [Plecturocebus cupreus]
MQKRTLLACCEQAVIKASQRLMQKNHWNRRGRGCSEQQWSHCIPHFSLGNRRQDLLCYPLEYSSMILAHCNLCFLGSSDFPTSASQVVGSTGIHHHTWLIFVFSVEIGFYHVAEAGLELLDSSNVPISVSQSVGITGLSALFTDPLITTLSMASSSLGVQAVLSSSYSILKGQLYLYWAVVECGAQPNLLITLRAPVGEANPPFP